jgi:hypothetical protein
MTYYLIRNILPRQKNNKIIQDFNTRVIKNKIKRTKYSVKRNDYAFYYMIQHYKMKFYHQNIWVKINKPNISKSRKFIYIKQILHYQILMLINSSKILMFKNYFWLRWHKLILLIPIAIFAIYFYAIRNNKLISYCDVFTKQLILNKICKNKAIIRKISDAIDGLCGEEKVLNLTKNLIIEEVYKNEQMEKDLNNLIKREIISYLQTKDCKNDLKQLLIEEVLRNSEIKNELYSLIKELLTLKEVNFLEDKLEHILVDVLNIQTIHEHVAKSKLLSIFI